MLYDVLVLILVAVVAAIYLLQHAQSKFRRKLQYALLSRGAFRSYQPQTHRDWELTPAYLHKNYKGLTRAVWRIVEYVLRDFIEHWYKNVSTNPDFPNDVRALMEHLFAVMAVKLSQVDWTSFLLKNSVSTLKDLLRIYRITEQQLESINPEFARASEERREAMLCAELSRAYKLHDGVSSVASGEAYIRKVSYALLSRIVKTRDFQCDGMRSLGREILTNNVMKPTFGFATPHWINVGVVNAIGFWLPFDQLPQALQAHFQPNTTNSTAPPTPAAAPSNKHTNTTAEGQTTPTTTTTPVVPPLAIPSPLAASAITSTREGVTAAPPALAATPAVASTPPFTGSLPTLSEVPSILPPASAGSDGSSAPSSAATPRSFDEKSDPASAAASGSKPTALARQLSSDVKRADATSGTAPPAAAAAPTDAAAAAPNAAGATPEAEAELTRKLNDWERERRRRLSHQQAIGRQAKARVEREKRDRAFYAPNGAVATTPTNSSGNSGVRSGNNTPTHANASSPHNAASPTAAAGMSSRATVSGGRTGASASVVRSSSSRNVHTTTNNNSNTTNTNAVPKSSQANALNTLVGIAGTTNSRGPPATAVGSNPNTNAAAAPASNTTATAATGTSNNNTTATSTPKASRGANAFDSVPSYSSTTAPSSSSGSSATVTRTPKSSAAPNHNAAGELMTRDLPPPASSLASPSSSGGPSFSGSSIGSITSSWSVKITGALTQFDPKPYVAYLLRVSNGQFAWRLVKRYNRFVELHDALVKKKIPNFDAVLPKKQLFGNFDAAFIQNRKQELQKYLDLLLWNRNVVESEHFRLFLIPAEDSDIQSTADEAGVGAEGGGGRGGGVLPANSALSASTTDMLMAGSGSRGGRHQSRASFSGPISSHENTTASPSKQAHGTAPPRTGAGTAQNKTSESVATPKKPQSSNPASSGAASSSTNSAASTGAGHPASANTTAAPQSTSAAISNMSISDIPIIGTAFNMMGAGLAAVGVGGDDSEPDPNAPTDWEAAAMTASVHDLIEEILDLHRHTNTTAAGGAGGGAGGKATGAGAWLGLGMGGIASSLGGVGFAVRRQVTWMAKQILRLSANGAIHTAVKEQVTHFTGEKQLVAVIDWLTSLLWPNGKLFDSKPPATDHEMQHWRAMARVALLKAIPSVEKLQTLLGREYCIGVTLKLFQFCQMEPLIKHWAYTTLDQLMVEMFPELGQYLNLSQF